MIVQDRTRLIDRLTVPPERGAPLAAWLQGTSLSAMPPTVILIRAKKYHNYIFIEYNIRLNLQVRDKNLF